MSPLLCHLSYPAMSWKVTALNDHILLGMHPEGKNFASTSESIRLARAASIATELHHSR
jgi:hypothetical protein